MLEKLIPYNGIDVLCSAKVTGYKDELDEVYLLGDARQVSNIMYAIWDAFEVANHI